MSKGGIIPTLGLACPSGGDFYICQGNSTQFLGCCTTNPCASGAGSCPQANLEPATFNKLDYQGIAAQSCISTKAAWYLCSALSTPFMGCCSSNACDSTAGCPKSDLVAAMLGNATQAKMFLTTTASALSTSKTATSSTIVSAATSAAVTAATTTTTDAATATGTAMSVGPGTELSTGAKAGIGVGAVALVALVGLLYLVIRRTIAKRRGVVVRGSEPPSPSTMSDNPIYGYSNRGHLTDSTLHPSGAHEPLWPSPAAAKFPYSGGSSPSISRETSLRSAASNNTLGVMAASPAEGQMPQYHQYGSHRGYTSQPLDTLAELDGGGVSPSPVISEMATSTPTTSRPPVPFRPYRPSR